MKEKGKYQFSVKYDEEFMKLVEEAQNGNVASMLKLMEKNAGRRFL